MPRLTILGLVLALALGFAPARGLAARGPAASGDDKTPDGQALQATAGQNRPEPPSGLSKQEDKSLRDLYRLRPKKPKPQ